MPKRPENAFTDLSAPAAPAAGRPARPRPSAPSRPSFFDYLLLLTGVALSVYLMRLAPLSAQSRNPLDPRLAQVFEFLVVLVRLPEGVLLLWPLLFATQWFGRHDGLTAAEWLWLLAWVGVLLLTAFTAWDRLLGLPESIAPYAGKPRVLWYLLVTPALAALAALILVTDLFRSRPTPWTHNLALASLLWPAPAALLLLFGGELVAG